MNNAEADVALGNLHNSPFNFQIMDLSIPYNVECLTFITPEVLNDNSWKTLISPFSLGMWAGVLVSLGLAGGIFFALSNVYKFIVDTATQLSDKDFFDSLSSCLLYTYSMILLVSLPRLPVRWSLRVLTGWYWIYCVLVVVAYRASLTSILANPQPRLTIDSLEVLAKSNLKSGASGEHNLNLFSLSSDEAAQKIALKIENVNDTNDVVCTCTHRTIDN
jgi:Ligand-gated ion channel